MLSPISYQNIEKFFIKFKMSLQIGTEGELDFSWMR